MRHGRRQVEGRRKVISVSLGGKDFQFLESGFLICNHFYIRFLVGEKLNSSISLYTKVKYVKCTGSQFILCSSVSESVVDDRNYWAHDLM
jgi:hypothetical protein